MTTRTAIKVLRKRGHPKRKIARELGIHRNTVDSHLAGDQRPEESNCTNSIPGSEPREDGASGREDSKCTIPTPGSAGSADGGGSGRMSGCEVYSETIGGKLAVGLKAKRIWQDLVDDHGFSGMPTSP